MLNFEKPVVRREEVPSFGRMYRVGRDFPADERLGPANRLRRGARPGHEAVTQALVDRDEVRLTPLALAKTYGVAGRI